MEKRIPDIIEGYPVVLEKSDAIHPMDDQPYENIKIFWIKNDFIEVRNFRISMKNQNKDLNREPREKKDLKRF